MMNKRICSKTSARITENLIRRGNPFPMPSVCLPMEFSPNPASIIHVAEIDDA